MQSFEAITATPFGLKQQGKFSDALDSYAAQFAKALETKNEFIAETCFDQMLDLVLLLLYVEVERQRERVYEEAASLRGRGNLQGRYSSMTDLKKKVRSYLNQYLPTSLHGRTLDPYFERSWDKFKRLARRQTRGFSVRKEQLVGVVRQSNDP